MHWIAKLSIDAMDYRVKHKHIVLQVQGMSKNFIEVGVAAQIILSLVAVISSLNLQSHFDRSKMKLNICHAPFGKILNHTASSCKFM